MAKDIHEAAEKVAAWLRLFIEPDQVTELRALDVSMQSYRKPHTEAGFYHGSELVAMARDALKITPFSRGVYFVMNPLNPNLLARCQNRLQPAKQDQQAHDTDVLCRRWLLIDGDKVGDPLISATDEEKAAVKETVLAVREYLRRNGWPEPILCDSGNGYHLMYRVDLPAADDGLVRRVLNAVADQFDGPRAKVDRKVFNPARICKLPGSLARKGEDQELRPHRRSRVLEVPNEQ